MPDLLHSYSHPILISAGDKGTNLLQTEKAKAQSNLKLAHGDTGCGRTGILTSRAPTKLALLSERYRLEERHLSLMWQSKAVIPPLSPVFLGQNQPLVVGQESLSGQCDYCCQSETVSPTMVTDFQDFNQRSSSSNKCRENYIIFI